MSDEKSDPYTSFQNEIRSAPAASQAACRYPTTQAQYNAPTRMMMIVASTCSSTDVAELKSCLPYFSTGLGF